MIAAILADTRARFLIAGGSAALVNWLARMPLSLLMPFGAAVLVAQAIGMAYGFLIYRGWAFRSSRNRPVLLEIRDFLVVNAAGAAVTVGVALAAEAGLAMLLDWPAVTEAVAHAIGIACGAVVNYLGHRHITFRG